MYSETHRQNTHRQLARNHESFSMPTLLVIDDEPDVRMFLTKIFKEQGAKVFEAPDCNQGMRLIKSESPDVITLDLVMPHKTGEKLYWELRKDAEYKNMPVVVVSGYASVDDPKIDFKGFLKEKGIPDPNGFVEKPIHPDKLINTVVGVLSGN